MKDVSFYHRDTGVIHPKTVLVSDESAIALNCPEDHVAIEGHFDHLCLRVDPNTGLVSDYQPPAPSSDHEWDEVSKRWRLNAEACDRAERKALAFARIAHLEANIQPRSLREVALNQPGAVGRLQAIDEEIAVLRRDIIG